MTTTRETSTVPARDEELALLAKLRDRDERTFMALVEELHPAMVRLARTFVPSQAVAEEVAQEAWVGVLNGIDRFEGRSSLKTWVMRIVTNQAIRRGQRERRTVPFSALAARDADGDEPVAGPDAFLPADHRWAGHWAAAPQPFPDPEKRAMMRETMDVVRAAIASLPEAQRVVISLRDIEGWDSADVCAALEITEVNQRVLLHRARGKVRSALDKCFAGADR
jgi:RNA polymerase sigma-70 factor (ECF subfamily)